MIRIATPEDVSRTLEITQSCALDLQNKGIFQWNQHYPSRAVFEQDVSENALFVYEFNHKILGCIMISDKKDEPYHSISWLTPDHKNLYVHRLAVHPLHQGQGIAKKLMDFAEAFAKNQNYVSIRLDTFSQNPRNIHFYEVRGYQKLGDVFFPKQSPFPFHCYEKVLVRN